MAVKSFPALEALSIAWDHLAGFDVSNVNELKQVQRAKPENRREGTVYWGTDPQFSWSSLPSSSSDDVFIFSLDHEQSLRKLEDLHSKLTPELQGRVKYAIRLNTNYILDEDVRTGKTSPSRFGAIPTAEALRPLMKSTV